MHVLNFQKPPHPYPFINLNRNDNCYRYCSYAYPFCCCKRYCPENPLEGWYVKHCEVGKEGRYHA